MAYDRYDSRGGERGGWRDNDRHPRDHRSGGRDQDERGFFERARDEVNSWFGDESSGGHDRDRYDRDEQHRFGEQHRPASQDRGMFGSGNQPWGRDRDEDRYRGQSRGGGMFNHDDDRERGRFGSEQHRDRGGFTGGGDRDRDRFGSNRERSYPGTLGQSTHSNRDMRAGGSSGRFDRDDDQYRPMTGDYGRSSQQGYRSGMGGQNFGSSQYGRQEFSQDQENDRSGGRPYNYGGWGDRDSQRQSYGSGGDDHYSQWRQRQIQELDRDYDDYRREHQSKFENEFTGWRQQKQTKRQMLHAIREHMEVVDENGEHIGTVDKVHGDRIVMTRNDPSAGGVHRSFSCTLLDRVDDKIHLSGSASTIRSQLREHREDDRDERGGGGFFSGLFGGGSSDDRRNEDRRDERPASTSTNRPEGEGPHMLDRSFSGTYDEDTSKKK